MSRANMRRVVLGLLVALALTLAATSCGWVLALALVISALLVAIGYGLAVNELYYDRTDVEAQRQALDDEWRMLDQTRRVRSIFLAARQAMQAEAQRHQTPGAGA